MARTKRQAFTNRFACPMTERDFGDAVRTVFGSREEIAEMFQGMEARLVARISRICEEAKRARDAEWPLPEEDNPPAADRWADPLPKVK